MRKIRMILIVCEPRGFVARNNAAYMNNDIRLRSKSIVRGNTSDSVKEQPAKSVIFCTTGKLKQMLQLFVHQPSLTANLCLVFSYWHVRNGYYTIVITMILNLLQRCLKFKDVFTSAFRLCKKWTNDIGLGKIIDVTFPKLLSNYNIVHVASSISKTQNEWCQVAVNLVTNICKNRKKCGWSIFITALGEDNVSYIHTLSTS